jgi:DNA processing protein
MPPPSGLAGPLCGITAASHPQMPHSEVIVNRLAVACLRTGPSTVVCRYLKGRLAGGRDASLEAIAFDLNINPLEAEALFTSAREQATRWLDEADRRQLDLVTALDPGYPDRLAEIPDPPVAFWRRGPAPLYGKAVAIVGSRTSTPAGLIVARQLSRDLAERGYTIVSGLAAGVDGAAHQAALDAGGATVAVLGCGVDVAYPYRHRALAAAIAESGCLVSEYPPGSEPEAWHFPMRNRIISGLAQAVVVVEASEKSGSLITAKCAMDQGRDVLAVPGSVASGRYRGCHALIRDGARLVETVDDILEELEGITRRASDKKPVNPLFISYLEPVMARGEPYLLDDLALRTGRPAQELLTDLGHLEIEGRIIRTTGGRFVRS